MMELRQKEDAALYQFGPFCLNKGKRVLYRNGMPVSISPKAFDTLSIFVENSGRCLAKNEIMKMVWPDSFVEEMNLKVQISILRKVLGESPRDHKFIVTVPGRGYSFVAPVKPVADYNAQASLAPDDSGRIPQPLTLAVFPFKFLNKRTEDEYLATGIADALITRISQIKHICIRSASNFSDLLNSDYYSTYELHFMGIEFLLVGTIQRSNLRARINAQLIRAVDGITMWAANFDEYILDTFALQDSVSQQVAHALSTKLVK